MDQAPGTSTGYDLLFAALHSWGIRLYAGVTGGGVVHFLQHLAPHAREADAAAPSFFCLPEYAAGFVPLGHFIATGQPAAGIATTGAATKLLACGLSDAKLHDIPAVYIVPISSRATLGLAPLQDTSPYGSNIVAQLRAEVPDSVFVLDDPLALPQLLQRAQLLLRQSKPVVLVLAHDALCLPATDSRIEARVPAAADGKDDIAFFVHALREASAGRRIVVLAGEQLGRCADAPRLTRTLCQRLGAPIVWSINGANGVARDNPYGFGYILFGGNDAATRLWSSLGPDDVLLVLGAGPDEYTFNLRPVEVAAAFFVDQLPRPYGQVEGSFAHRVQGRCHELQVPLEQALRGLVEACAQAPFANRRSDPAPAALNDKPAAPAAAGYVDLAHMYRLLDAWWPPDSLGFDDVCQAYKDRQYVTQRPHPHIRFHSFYRGSAMGGAYGAAVGAKLGAPHKQVYLFTGDGCFRLFAGCLGETRHLGLVMFVLDNREYAIVRQGLRWILPHTDPVRYHAALFALDHAAIARASGWHGCALRPDLSNLLAILDDCRQHPHRSTLIEVPVDGRQALGANPRVANLM